VAARAARTTDPGGTASGQTGIVYCSTRAQVEEVCDLLHGEGFAATRYHAGLSAEERRANQDEFLYDYATVMVATNAFGMGIDKSNVGFVIHYNMPRDLESYYQEAGRAGRDGTAADCILIYNKKDVQTGQFMIDRSRDEAYENGVDPALAEELYRRDCERLRRMTLYCTTTDCLRSTILRYFGENDAPFRCEHCSNCQTDVEVVDATVDAQKVASCVLRIERTGRRVGKTAVVDVLRGSASERIAAWGLDALPTFGAMAGQPAARVRYVLDALVDAGYLEVSPGTYPTVATTARGREWLLRTREPFELKVPGRLPKEVAPAAAASAPGGKPAPTGPADQGLLAELRALRTRVAAEEQMPAYIVFSNKTLEDMAAKAPATPEAFLEVSGVGAAKAQRYGERFLACIAAWRARAE
jgi:ATP-dependent DNA helicase RecQ